MEITKYQRGLMQHTISGHNRNWFATSKNCTDGLEFEKLVEAGYATSEPAPSWSCDDVVYRLTGKGKSALKEVIE